MAMFTTFSKVFTATFLGIAYITRVIAAAKITAGGGVWEPLQPSSHSRGGWPILKWVRPRSGCGQEQETKVTNKTVNYKYYK